jgi:hypothetical protein
MPGIDDNGSGRHRDFEFEKSGLRHKEPPMVCVKVFEREYCHKRRFPAPVVFFLTGKISGRLAKY